MKLNFRFIFAVFFFSFFFILSSWLQPIFASTITGVVFDDTIIRTLAPGSDNWPITWAGDNQLYTSWGDGGGFGGTNTNGRVSLGVGRIEGSADNYQACNLAGGVTTPGCSPPAAAPFSGKSEGIVALGNTLYLWRNGDGSNTNAFKFSKLYRSTDFGRTWTDTGVEFSKTAGDFPVSHGFFSPTFLQYGQGYTESRDDYVYLYAPEIIDPTHWNIQKPGKINLFRVLKSQIENKSQYQFYSGRDASGQPLWTNNVESRQPVWQDSQGTHRMAVSYNAPLRRYLLTSVTVDTSGHLAIYESPEPWGNWTKVFDDYNPNRWGNRNIIYSFVNKWLSPNGQDFVLVYTLNDQWASIKGHFQTNTSPPPTTSPFPTPTPSANINPSAYWNFNEGQGNRAHDLSGNNNHGSLSSPSWVKSFVEGTALSFNGLNDTVIVPSHPTLDLKQDFSFATWVYFDSLPTQGSSKYPRLLQKGNSAAQTVYYLGVDTTNQNQLELRVSLAGQKYSARSLSSLQPGHWYHLVVTREGSQVKFYLNGQLDQQIKDFPKNNIDTNQDSLFLGESPGNTDGAVDGIIDNLSIFPRALSSSEVKLLFDTRR